MNAEPPQMRMTRGPDRRFRSGVQDAFLLQVLPGTYDILQANSEQGLLSFTVIEERRTVGQEGLDLGQLEISTPATVELELLIRGPGGSPLGGVTVAPTWFADFDRLLPAAGAITDDTGRVSITHPLDGRDEV